MLRAVQHLFSQSSAAARWHLHLPAEHLHNIGHSLLPLVASDANKCASRGGVVDFQRLVMQHGLD